MLARWPSRSYRERHAYQVACAFLVDRLEEQSTIDWALSLKPERLTERLAVLDVLHRQRRQHLTEPWRSAWHWIEEFWHCTPESGSSSGDSYAIRERIK